MQPPGFTSGPLPGLLVHKPPNGDWTPGTAAEHDVYMDIAHSKWTMEDIRREFQRYCDLVNASDRKPSTKTTYIQHADRFVRWLAGETDV